MKKVFLALAAVAALAACSKSEAQYDDVQKEISFAPVTKNITKSMITGSAFPKAESFNIWAWYKQVPTGTTVANWAPTNNEHLYVTEGKFVNQTGDRETWKGETSYYWPKVGSLLFAGYYPSTADTYAEYTFNSATNNMVFRNYPQGVVAASGNSEDLMYFNMTANSTNSGPVSVAFKHALSWVTVNLSRPSDNPDNKEYPKIKVNSVTFTNVNNKGTGTVTGTEGTINWLTTGDIENTVVTANEGVVLSSTPSKQTEPLFIPQAFTEDNVDTKDKNEAMELQVNYTIYSSSNEHFTETYTIKLKGMNGTIGSETSSLSAWEPAKHYTYNISISLSEILIQPTVTDWTDVTVPVQY